MIPKWWSLVIVFSAFMIQLVTFGIAGAIGLYNIELIKYYKVGAAEVSLIGSINLGFFLGAGPIVSLLMRRLGHRKTAIIGSFLGTISLLCIPFLDDIIYLDIIYGIITGFGFAMAYLPSSVLAGLYFDKHRSLATGIATSGSGLGNVVFPLLVHSLIEYYGWKGSMIILSGFMFQCVVFAALLFPVEEKVIKEDILNKLLPNKTIEDSENKVGNGHILSNKKVEKTIVQDESEHDSNDHVCINENVNMLQIMPENNSEKITSEQNDLEKDTPKHCYVLTDFAFFIFFLNNLFWNMGAAISWVLGPEYFVEMGLSKENAATAMTFGGVGCFVGCIVGGGLGNIKRLSRLSMYIIYNIGTSVFTLILPIKIFQTAAIISLIITLNGLAFGGILGLLVIFTVDLLGEKALGDGFGYLMLSNGLGALIAPPIGGLLKDTFGTYESTFLFAGSLNLAAGLLMFLIPMKNHLSPSPRRTKEITIEMKEVSTDV